MSALLRAELRKLTGRRLLWGLLAVLVGLEAMNMILVPVLLRVLPSEQGMAPLRELVGSLRLPAGFVFAVQTSVGQVMLLVAILTAIAVGNEYGWGTMALTLTLEPRRGRVLAAKAVSLVFVAALGTLVAALVGMAFAAAAQPILPTGAPSVFEGNWVVAAAGVWLRSFPALAFWVLLTSAVAIMTRSPGAAAGVGVGVVLVDQVFGLATALQPFLVSTNTQALTTVGRVGTGGGAFSVASLARIPAWRAAAVLCAYGVVVGAVAWWRLSRQEVT